MPNAGLAADSKQLFQTFQEPSHKNSNIKHYDEQELPNIQPGITLDKYFGCNFTVVKQDENMKFDEEFCGKHEIDKSIQQYL